MRSLTDVYETISSKDAELEKQAGELIKKAEEDDAAGRITARGFADELSKLAGPGDQLSGFTTKSQGGSVPVGGGGYNTGGGNTGANYGRGGKPQRRPQAQPDNSVRAGRAPGPGRAGTTPPPAPKPKPITVGNNPLPPRQGG